MEIRSQLFTGFRQSEKETELSIEKQNDVYSCDVSFLQVGNRDEGWMAAGARSGGLHAAWM